MVSAADTSLSQRDWLTGLVYTANTNKSACIIGSIVCHLGPRAVNRQKATLVIDDSSISICAPWKNTNKPADNWVEKARALLGEGLQKQLGNIGMGSCRVIIRYDPLKHCEINIGKYIIQTLYSPPCIDSDKKALILFIHVGQLFRLNLLRIRSLATRAERKVWFPTLLYKDRNIFT